MVAFLTFLVVVFVFFVVLILGCIATDVKLIYKLLRENRKVYDGKTGERI